MGALKGKTLFITGGSRGIGLAIALRAARDGANVAIAAKTDEPHRHLPGTIHTAAEEILQAGGNALPILTDVRSEESVAAAIEATVARFGGVDICVNNASAINLLPSDSIQMKQFDLMQQVNVRGTFMTSKLCAPHLRRAENPHVLTMSPPLDLSPDWFAGHVGYTMSKFGMSMAVLGMAEEFRTAGIAFNGLWPRHPIATAAVEFALGVDRDFLLSCRTAEIMADAAYAIVTQPSRSVTGRFFIDDNALAELTGMRDFEGYRIDPSRPLAPDLFVRQEAPLLEVGR